MVGYPEFQKKIANVFIETHGVGDQSFQETTMRSFGHLK